MIALCAPCDSGITGAESIPTEELSLSVLFRRFDCTKWRFNGISYDVDVTLL